MNLYSCRNNAKRAKGFVVLKNKPDVAACSIVLPCFPICNAETQRVTSLQERLQPRITSTELRIRVSRSKQKDKHHLCALSVSVVIIHLFYLRTLRYLRLIICLIQTHNPDLQSTSMCSALRASARLFTKINWINFEHHVCL